MQISQVHTVLFTKIITLMIPFEIDNKKHLRRHLINRNFRRVTLLVQENLLTIRRSPRDSLDNGLRVKC